MNHACFAGVKRQSVRAQRAGSCKGSGSPCRLMDMPDKPDDDIKLPPLERYFRIIEMLAVCPQGLSLMEIGKVLMLPKASVHRLLSTMQRSNLVQLSNNGRPKYSLTERVRRLAYHAIDNDAVASLAASLLNDFSRKYGETCYLCRLEDATVRSIAIASPATPWRGYVLPGRVLQPHATAGGKAIMAFQSKELIDRALAEGTPALTSWTKTDRKAILADYAEIRKNHFSTCIKEVEAELAAFAVPIEVGSLGVQYCVGVLGPYSRIIRVIDDEPRGALQELAEAIKVILSRIAGGTDG